MTLNSTATPIDLAARVFLNHAKQGLAEIARRQLDPAIGLQATIQMSMRLYADVIGDDLMAIDQIRGFIDDWEAEATELPFTFSFATTSLKL